MYSLHNVGPALERVSGKSRMLASYVAGGFVGAALQPTPTLDVEAPTICLSHILAMYPPRANNNEIAYTTSKP
eukprot:1383313-Pyramimonas_sp.AAC.2